MIHWQRYGGYDITTRGDSRFSAFKAKLADGRTIEEHYQCDIKGHDPGGTDWFRGKGKPPKDPSVDLFAEYLELWRQWAIMNPELMTELRVNVRHFNNILSDQFATSPVNQAHALAVLLNEIIDIKTDALEPSLDDF